MLQLMNRWKLSVSKVVLLLGAVLLSLFIQMWLLDYYLADLSILAMRDFEESNPDAGIDEVARIGDMRLEEPGIVEMVYGKVDYIAAIPFFVAGLLLSGGALIELLILIVLSIAASYPRLGGVAIYTVAAIIGWILGSIYRKSKRKTGIN